MAGAADVVLTGPQKCAVLCLALDEKDGAKILRQLGENELVEVAQQMARMQTVSADLVTRVLREVHSAVRAETRTVRGGVQEARRLLEQALGPTRAEELLGGMPTPVAPARLTQLEQMEPEAFAGALQEEQPQTIAVILSHLNPLQASQVLKFLPLETAAEIVYRVARMEKISPEMVALVDAGLRSKTDLSFPRATTATGGPAAAARVLSSMGGELHRQLLAQLGERNRELVTQIENLMFVFEDLLQIDSKGIQQVLRDIDARDLALALKAASPELKKHLKANMAQRAAAALDEELEMLGPVRVTDVQAAQRGILETVRGLEEDGKIVIRRAGDSDEYI